MNAFLLIVIIFGMTLQQVARKAYNIRVKGGVYSFKADGDMNGLTVILHGICAEGVKAENAQIHTDSVSGCVSAAIDTSTREVKITVE